MPLPAGITTAEVTFGQALGVAGSGASLDATVEVNTRVMWYETGDVIYPFPEPVEAGEDGMLRFRFPHVDQFGFVDAEGKAIRYFHGILRVTITPAAGVSVYTVEKPFQVVGGIATLDLDRVPDGGLIPEDTYAAGAFAAAANADRKAAEVAKSLAVGAEASASRSAARAADDAQRAEAAQGDLSAAVQAAATSAADAEASAERADDAAEDAAHDRIAARDSATAAQASAGAAATSATQASQAAQSASLSAATATMQAEDAAEAASAAAGSAQTAGQRATDAAGSATAAAGSATSADTARGDAVAARAGAEAARQAAETAKAAINVTALPVLAKNLLPRPLVSPGSTFGWGFSGPGSASAFTAPVDPMHGPQARVTITNGEWTTGTAVTAGGTGTTNTYRAAVTPGRVYSFAIRGIYDITGLPAHTASARVRWFGSDGLAVGTLTSSPAAPVLAGVPADLAVEGVTAPPGAAYAGVDVVFTSTVWRAGDWYAALWAMCIEGDRLPGGGIFDGNSSGARWTGTPNASPSELVLPRSADLLTPSARRYYEGVGSPEGTVRAAPGAEYLDRAGTHGAWVWRKRANTDSTGWVVVEGDTGWRSVAVDGPNLAGVVSVRRIGDDVHWRGQDTSSLTGAVASGQVFVTVPTGFRPLASLLGWNWALSPATPSRPMTYSSTALRLWLPGSETAGTIRFGSVTYFADNPWPTTLPGAPA